MKKIFLWVVFFIGSVSLSIAQVMTDDQKAVQNTVVKMFEALSNRDSISLKTYCTPDILLFESGRNWNLDTLIRKTIRLSKPKDFKRINTIDFINTTIDKNVAWATYNNRADITQNGNHFTILWIETVVLIKERKQWKIKVLHSTFLKKT